MRKSFSIIAGVVLLIGAVLVPITATFITFVLPGVFASTARILPAVTEPTAIATEVEIIRSKAVLLQVVTNLNLARRYAEKFKEEVELPVDLIYAILSRQSVIKQTQGTHVIEITAFSEERIEAAAIANEIALVYTNSPLAARGADAKAVPQIIDKATPAFRPARPNKVLNIASGVGVGAILALIGGWLILNCDLGRARVSDESQRTMTGGQPPPLPSSKAPPGPRP